MGIWFLGFWGFGVLGFWGFGVLGFWGFGVLGFWGFGVWGFGVLGFWGKTKEMVSYTYDAEHKGFTSGVQISDNHVLLGAENGNLNLYKCSPSGLMIGSYPNIHNSSITQILTINETFVITCSTDKTIKIFDVNRKSVVDEYEKLHTDSVEDILIQVALPGRHIIDKIVLIIGGYKLPVKKEKLLIIAPIFKQFIRDEDVIE